LELRYLLPLWSQVRALLLLIWWPLETYMVVNFRAHGISRGARKLPQTPTLNYKKIYIYIYSQMSNNLTSYFIIFEVRAQLTSIHIS
jgi:hypothetical protein